jgi:hypothetical protein
MDVLQINYMTFLTQAVALGIWVCIAAALYAVVENMIEGRSKQ